MQEAADVAYLREKASWCRRLADSVTDEPTITALRSLAEQYEEQAALVEARALHDIPPPPMTE